MQPENWHYLQNVCQLLVSVTLSDPFIIKKTRNILSGISQENYLSQLSQKNVTTSRLTTYVYYKLV